MIRLHKETSALILEYFGEFAGKGSPAKWLDDKLSNGEDHVFKNTFHVNKTMLAPSQNNAGENAFRYFIIGLPENGYYKIRRESLEILNDLYLSHDLSITEKTFIASGQISVFKAIDRLIKEPIFIGGQNPNAIPKGDFYALLKNFPTQTELSHYANSRISGILSEYLGSITDAQKRLDRYVAKRKTIKAKLELESISDYELHKYNFIRDRIEEMLADPDSYIEKDWEQKILEFILVLYPKYVKVLHSIPVRDFYSDPEKTITREIDLGLLDSNGNLDIIEIKKPFVSCILSTRPYRDNYVPKQELSGAVVQAEKYVFHLNKWGIEGEKKLNNKYKGELPEGLEIRIINPKAILILGRSKDFDGTQKFDFEIIRRKYSNIMDIVTYDDLLSRLNHIIAKFKL